MDGQAAGGIPRFFAGLPDPRAHNVIHKLHDILVIAVCAVICGADGWAEVEEFGHSKQSWFKTFLDLPGGIPSHDTFGRVFARLAPDAFERCFVAWTAALPAVAGSGAKLVAIDGKSRPPQFRARLGQERHGPPGQRVRRRQPRGLRPGRGGGQVQRDRGDPAAAGAAGPVRRATVTVDAIGCQTEVARQVVEAEGDYVLAVKANQPMLHAKVKALLDEAILDGFEGVRHGALESTDGGHGRVERRWVWVTDEVHWPGEALVANWPGLASVAAVERAAARTWPPARSASSAATSSAAARASTPGRWPRRCAGTGQWRTGCTGNWTSASTRTSGGSAPGTARRTSRACAGWLNLLKRDKSVKIGVHGKRLKAGWDEPYLLRLLTS